MVPALFVLIGAFALAAQTLVLREYLVLHGGNELALGLFYGSWFGWIALAASTYWILKGRRREDPAQCSPEPDGSGRAPHRQPSPTARSSRDVLFNLLLVAYPVALIAEILLIRATRSLADLPPAEPMAFGSLAAWTVLSNAPVSVVTGVIFPVGCAVLQDSSPVSSPSRAVARAYIFESVGSFAGGLVVTVLISSFVAAVPITLGITVALAAAGGLHARRERIRWAAVAHAAVALAALTGLISPWGRGLAAASVRDRFAANLPDARLIASGDTPYQHASVAKLGEQVLLLSNGRIVATLPDDEAHAMRAALLMTQPAETRRVLLVGASAQGMVPHLLRYPVEHLLYVEPDERAFQLAKPHLPPAIRRALADPRVELSFADGRSLVRSLARAGTMRFDLLLVVVPDPDTAAQNRYFTVDFYRTAARLLADDGVLATRISSGDNVLGTELASYGASIHESLRSAFTEVLVIPGEESWFVAGRRAGQASVDPSELARRYRSMSLARRSFPAEGFHSQLDPERIRFVTDAYRGLARGQRDELVNRDTRPVTYFLNLLVLGRHTGSTMVDVLRACRDVGIWLVALPLLALIALRVHRLVAERPHLRGGRDNGSAMLMAVGLSSIALEIVLLFAFQSRFGLLYQQVGLVSALFMVGLAMGAAAAMTCARRRGPDDHQISVAGGARPALWVVALCAGLALVMPGLLGGLGNVAPAAAKLAYYGLFLLTGALSGAAFPLATIMAQEAGGRAGTIGAVLQSADHFGAALGALLVGTLLVPAFGIRTTCGLVAAVLGSSFVALWCSSASVLPRLRRVRRRWLRWHRPPGVAAVSLAQSFPWSRLSYALVAIVFVATIPAALLRHSVQEPEVRIGPHRLASVVQAHRFVERSAPFLHYLAFDDGGAPFHNATLASFAVADDIQGYAGPLNLLVSVDADGTIRRVELISSDETPAYIADLDSWLKRFEGKSVAGSFRLASDTAGDAYQLDGMTGATVTSRAVVGTINASAAALGKGVLGLELEHDTAVAAPSPWTAEVIALLTAMLAGIFVMWRASDRRRTAFLAAVLVVMGIGYNVQLSLGHVVDISRGLMPSPANLLLFVLVLGVALLGVAMGPAYCAVLCPFGAAQEMVFGADRTAPASSSSSSDQLKRWLRRGTVITLAGLLVDRAAPALLPSITSRPARDALLGAALLVAYLGFRRVLGPRASAVRPSFHARARYAKYVLLAVVLVVSAWGSADWIIAFDPLTVAFSGTYDGWTFLLLATLLLLCLRYFRFWCRFFCPVGALLHLFNKVFLLRRWLRPKVHARCDLGVRSSDDVDCIQCNRCLAGVTLGRSSCLAWPRLPRSAPRLADEDRRGEDRGGASG